MLKETSGPMGSQNQTSADLQPFDGHFGLGDKLYSERHEEAEQESDGVIHGDECEDRGRLQGVTLQREGQYRRKHDQLSGGEKRGQDGRPRVRGSAHGGLLAATAGNNAAKHRHTIG